MKPVTFKLDDDLADRVAALRAAGVAVNVSAAARAGVLAEVERLEAKFKRPAPRR